MLPSAVQKLVAQFNRLPGIGPKTAEKFVWYLLRQPNAHLEAMAEQLLNLKKTIQQCPLCFQITDRVPCAICADPKRQQRLLCVVTDPADVEAIERTHAFDGVYHVLGESIDPVRGIGPEHLHTKELLQRIIQQRIEEVMFATNPDIPGETTVLTLSAVLKPTGVKITRLGRGLPMGSDLDYADEVTLTSAITGRKTLA